MKIKYKNSIDDLVKLNMDIFKKDPVIQKRIKIKHIILPIFIILDFLVVSWFNNFIMNKLSYLFLAFCLFIIISWILFYPKLAEVQYRKMLIKRLKNNIKNDFDLIVTIDKSGIREESQNGNVTYCWDKVEEVKDIGTHIFIYISNLNAIVIPSNSFRDEREKNELIKIINENINKTNSDNNENEKLKTKDYLPIFYKKEIPEMSFSSIPFIEKVKQSNNYFNSFSFNEDDFRE